MIRIQIFVLLMLAPAAIFAYPEVVQVLMGSESIANPCREDGYQTWDAGTPWSTRGVTVPTHVGDSVLYYYSTMIDVYTYVTNPLNFNCTASDGSNFRHSFPFSAGANAARFTINAATLVVEFYYIRIVWKSVELHKACADPIGSPVWQGLHDSYFYFGLPQRSPPSFSCRGAPPLSAHVSCWAPEDWLRFTRDGSGNPKYAICLYTGPLGQTEINRLLDLPVR